MLESIKIYLSSLRKAIVQKQTNKRKVCQIYVHLQKAIFSFLHIYKYIYMFFTHAKIVPDKLRCKIMNVQKSVQQD